MDELLPVLVSTLFDDAELRGLVQAALDGTPVLVPIDLPPVEVGLHAVELNVAGRRPVVLVGEPAGEWMGSMLLMKLRPFDELHAHELERLLEQPTAPGTSSRRASFVTLDDVVDAEVAAKSIPPSSSTLIARVLGGGKYELLSLLGEGGMATVFRGRQVALDRPIAVKIMHGYLRKDPTFARRFHTEALAASKLEHPNVTRVYDFGEEPDGLLYLVMELVAGRDLRVLVETEQLSLARRIDIVCQLCTALAAAAERGIVHRDVKPENLIIVAGHDDDGKPNDLVKVCDFGLATVQLGADATPSATRMAAAALGTAGTPEYMSPEQIRCEELDARSDVYACGVVLYELVTGRLPFTEKSGLDTVQKQLHEAPRPPRAIVPELQPQLEKIILKALGKRREERQQSARELKAELRAFVDSQRRPAGPSIMAPTTIGLGDPQAGFAELFTSLTGAVARTTYYEREHPEFGRSLGRLVDSARAPLAGRGEITIAQRDVRDPTQLLVQSGLGEIFDLRRVLPAGLAEAYAPRLAEALGRRHVVALTLKEGIRDAELADTVELLSGPQIQPEKLRAAFASRELPHVSVLFAFDLLGRKRSLPWQVDLCISRLARDLGTLPLYRGVGQVAMLQMRGQLVEDVLRAVNRPDDAELLLENCDLIATAVSHVSELASLDAVAMVVAAMRHALCVRVAGLVTADLERCAAARLRGAAEAAAGEALARRLIEALCARFVRERTVQSDDLLRELARRAILALGDLPPDVQGWVAAEQFAERLLKEPAAALAALDAEKRPERLPVTIGMLGRAAEVLARQAETVALWAVLQRLIALSRGKPPGDDGPEALAAKAWRVVADPQRLGPSADAALGGVPAKRDAARQVLVACGAAAAPALCDARGRSEPERVLRSRFVAVMRELDAVALPALTAALNGIDAAAPPDLGLLEDLLRAVPDVAGDAMGEAVARYSSHAIPAIRRAALGALASAWGSRARVTLRQAVDDADEGVRVAALTGLRKAQGIDVALVRRIDDLLSAPAIGEDVRAGAAGALADALPQARAEAVEVLKKALRPKSRSFVGILRDAVGTSESVLVLETVARVLIVLAGAEGRREVEQRANASRGDVKKALSDLLAARTG